MLHTSRHPTAASAISALGTTVPQAPFDTTPVIHSQDGQPFEHSRTFWSAVANACYIVRRDGEDLFGPTPRF